MTNNILWLITARSGSKSIKDKNIKLLNKINKQSYGKREIRKNQTAR